jgi:hypothetical protein
LGGAEGGAYDGGGIQDFEGDQDADANDQQANDAAYQIR